MSDKSNFERDLKTLIMLEMSTMDFRKNKENYPTILHSLCRALGEMITVMTFGNKELYDEGINLLNRAIKAEAEICNEKLQEMLTSLTNKDKPENGKNVN